MRNPAVAFIALGLFLGGLILTLWLLSFAHLTPLPQPPEPQQAQQDQQQGGTPSSMQMQEMMSATQDAIAAQQQQRMSAAMTPEPPDAADSDEQQSYPMSLPANPPTSPEPAPAPASTSAPTTKLSPVPQSMPPQGAVAAFANSLKTQYGLPHDLDGFTTLQDIYGESNNVHYLFVIKTPPSDMDIDQTIENIRTNMQENACGRDDFRQIMNVGFNITLHFKMASGKEYPPVMIPAHACPDTE